MNKINQKKLRLIKKSNLISPLSLVMLSACGGGGSGTSGTRTVFLQDL